MARSAAQRSRSARAYRSAGSIPFLSRSACTSWCIRYTVYGVRYTLYVLYRLWAGWSRESLDKALESADRSLSGSALARSLCTENGIHGRCVRATARRVPFFILRPSPTAAPFGRLLRVLESRPGKRRSYSPAKRERITSQ